MSSGITRMRQPTIVVISNAPHAEQSDTEAIATASECVQMIGSQKRPSSTYATRSASRGVRREVARSVRGRVRKWGR
jgi:hypothetical protein